MRKFKRKSETSLKRGYARQNRDFRKDCGDCGVHAVSAHIIRVCVCKREKKNYSRRGAAHTDTADKRMLHT